MSVSQSLTLTQSSQNIENNSSQVRILWRSTQTEGSYNMYTRTAKYYVSINGGPEVVYSVTYQLPKTSTKTIVDTTITVPHNTDGTGSVRVRTWMDTDISAGVIEQTKTLTLSTIPRATTPTFHANVVDMGGTLTIYLNRASTAFTHDLAYSFKGGEYIDIVKGATTVHYWATPDLAEQIPNAIGLNITVRCITKSGGTVVGTKTATFMLKVPSNVTPQILSVTPTESTAGLAAQFGAFVNGHSNITVSIMAVGEKGSTITSYSTTFGGKTYTGSRFTAPVQTGAGLVDMVTTITDSRGRKDTMTTEIRVLDYYPPMTSRFIAYRVDANGDAKSDGKYVKVDYVYYVAPVGDKNTASMTIKYKRSTASSWAGTVLTDNSLRGSGVVKLTREFTSDYQFDLLLTVTDWFGKKAEYQVTIPTAKVILDIKAGGDGFAFGKTAEFPGVEVDMPASAESLLMIGVRSHDIGEGYGHVLYNNGLLLQWGSVSIVPVSVDDVTAVNVKFPIAYKARPHISGTLLANTPQAVEWGFGVGTSAAEALQGLMIYMKRTGMYATPFRWMAVGLADMTKVVAE